uniref:Uncharacterized protein n=1 Tax=Acrobeloides nanus TaxID=290746 RepID=A0A914ECK0_9BILA
MKLQGILLKIFLFALVQVQATRPWCGEEEGEGVGEVLGAVTEVLVVSMMYLEIKEVLFMMSKTNARG